MGMRSYLFIAVLLFTVVPPVPCRAANDIPKEMRGILLYAPDPEYPNEVAFKGITGHGTFRATIDPRTGRVTEVKVIKSTPHRILNELSAKALLQWRFQPRTITSLEVPFTFGVTGYSRTVH